MVDTVLNEVLVDQSMYEMCKAIHFGNPSAASCRNTITNVLFKDGLDYRLGDESIRLLDYYKKEVVDRHWIPFAIDCMNEIWTRGIIPVTVKRSASGDNVPVVARGPHEIRSYYDHRRDRYSYRFYRLISKKTGQCITPKHDKRVTVLSGFGYDPNELGKLRSLVSTLVKSDMFADRMKDLALRAESDRCKPRMVLQHDKAPNEYGIEGTYSYYGGRDRIMEKEEDRFIMGPAEMESVANQDRQYDKIIQETFREGGKNLTKKAMANGMTVTLPPYPLPPGYSIAHQLLPEPRNDLLEICKQAEETICMAYGVPRSVISDGGRAAYSGIRTNVDTLNRTLLKWKDIVGTILTNMYRCIYFEGDCDYYIGKMDDEDKEGLLKLTETQRRSLIEARVVVTVTPQLMLSTTHEDLLTQYFMDVIDYDMLNDYSRKLAGMPPRSDDKKRKDPFNFKNNEPMMELMKRQILKGTIFGQLGSNNNNNNEEEEGKDEDNNNTESVSTRSEESEAESEQKKKKRKTDDSKETNNPDKEANSSRKQPDRKAKKQRKQKQ
jgi:hypothetical protein